MTITLNGTTGIQNVLGSAASPAESNTTNSNTGVYFPTSTSVGISTNGTNALTIDASQNVTLNNVIPSSSTAPTNGMFLPAANTIGLATNSTERARIDSSGNLLVGTTSALSGNTFKANSGAAATFSTATSTNFSLVYFNNGTYCGSITTNGSATAFNTSSDYRLKENVQPMTGALTKIALLKPVVYKWKINGADGEGFIAHELAEIFPDAVAGEKDAVDKDGNIKPQGIDTSFLVATLTAAIQEQQALITQLTDRIAALEAK